MRHLATTAIASAMIAIAIMTYASPVLLTVAWVRRLKGKHGNGIRERAGWLSLVLSSLGLVLLIIAMKVSPDPGSPALDIWFAKWLKICTVVSCFALGASIAGAGKMQWVVRVSAAMPPLALLVAKVLE
jgi:hypothetical protein